jgi:hypothetical protein
MVRFVFAAALLAAGVFGTMNTADAAPTVAGAVNANGTAQIPSLAYSVSHPATGHYHFTFAKPYAVTALLTVTPIGPVRVSGILQTANTADVYFVDLGTGNPEDVLFNFIAVQISH